MNQQWAAKAQETAYAESLDTTALQTPIAAPSRPIHSTPSSHCVPIVRLTGHFCVHRKPHTDHATATYTPRPETAPTAAQMQELPSSSHSRPSPYHTQAPICRTARKARKGRNLNAYEARRKLQHHATAASVSPQAKKKHTSPYTQYIPNPHTAANTAPTYITHRAPHHRRTVTLQSVLRARFSYSIPLALP
ncbi:predicted protein [Plenodomus lingam JN3]|uniref:Predicted protein n=1 Tax=Leptosphaeria maculans (strain JN3 / isolate v23.1.3 / race Av1-4-5-6-7-8) TaxID=985895 RepID=E5ABT4_LEPMJ|nr:predicted protein [Plenodomus lingam JN3]CBY01125.1 predicted protein [Plenodomus lingam JN3]